MSAAEIQQLRDKGLCYFCDDKFSYSHKCPNKHLMLLQIEEEDETEQEPDPPDTKTDSESSEVQEHHLSLNAMKGRCAIGTIRFSGMIGNILVQILLDGGSSESFLQPRIAQFLKILVAPEPSFRVLIGNGQTMQTEG